MFRRHRRHREIPFSFDSFLDVVANVVGIIIRLILVVWVSARSYSSVSAYLDKPRKAEAASTLTEIRDPLQDQLSQQRQELARAQQRLLEQLRRLQQAQAAQAALETTVNEVNLKREAVQKKMRATDLAASGARQALLDLRPTLADWQRRQESLLREIKSLEDAPSLTHAVRYRTPVSRPVSSEEFFFECKGGRVAFIDIASLLAEVRRDVEDKGSLLKTQWEIRDETAPVGAFRLKYAVTRERGLVDSIAPGATPDAKGNYRYGLSEWTVEPVTAFRGESATAAIAEKSEFRGVIDRLDPQQAVVTFWVYPDSFAVYRRLRDYLYDRSLVVAGRPLPAGFPIICSRNGSLSRGQ